MSSSKQVQELMDTIMSAIEKPLQPKKAEIEALRDKFIRLHIFERREVFNYLRQHQHALCHRKGPYLVDILFLFGKELSFSYQQHLFALMEECWEKNRHVAGFLEHIVGCFKELRLE